MYNREYISCCDATRGSRGQRGVAAGAEAGAGGLKAVARRHVRWQENKRRLADVQRKASGAWTRAM